MARVASPRCNRTSLLLIAVVVASALIQGCAKEETKVTPKDKANIERLAKEGIGMPQANEEP